MPAVCRIGDIHTHGGAIIEGSPNVFANGLSVARLGDAVNCIVHGTQTIISASSTVFVNGQGIARVGDLVSCGGLLSSGSPDVFAG